eukprot:scaffold93401_cov28-Tisochrysis_lutea.AAC.1
MGLYLTWLPLLVKPLANGWKEIVVAHGCPRDPLVLPCLCPPIISLFTCAWFLSFSQLSFKNSHARSACCSPPASGRRKHEPNTAPTQVAEKVQLEVPFFPGPHPSILVSKIFTNLPLLARREAE